MPGCSYATGDLDAVVVAALLNAHCVVHSGKGASGAGPDASSSTITSKASTSSEDVPAGPHLR